MSKIDCGGNWLACPSYIGNTAGTAVTPPSCIYVAEDGVTPYVAEDGVTNYRPEVCPGDLDLGSGFVHPMLGGVP